MKDITEQILLYAELSPEARRAVEDHVAAHPELAPLLDEARAFTRVLQEARRLSSPVPDDEILAYVVATRYLTRHQQLPEALQAPLARIEARLARDAGLKARHDVFARRMIELEASLDALAQFERLSGFSLTPPERPRQAPPQPDRPPRMRRLYLRTARWAVAATVVLVGLYSSLYLVDQFSRSDRTRAALLEPDGMAAYAARAGQVRGTFALAPVDSLFLSGLYHLQSAQTTTLGLFPRFRPEPLRRALDALDGVVAEAPFNSFLYLEARYYRGKARLAAGDVAGARLDFRAVVDGQGNKAPEAAHLLDLLAG